MMQSNHRALAIVVAAAAILAVGLLISEHYPGDSHAHDRRQLRALAGLDDPRTVAPRFMVPSSFQYGFSSDPETCVDPKEVGELASALRDLYERHGVRAFPRNGFLLGVIRHGGFLPNEGNADADTGIAFDDVEKLMRLRDPGNNTPWIRVGEFTLAMKPTEEDWVNWKGLVPDGSGRRYPFFGVRIKRGPSFSLRTQSVYPYRDGSTYFYPRLNRARYNHESHTREIIRYNTEGADFRLLDSDELLTDDNNQDGLQIGNDFHSRLNCWTLRQFYFTMIYVPCDYDAVLQSFYGENWSHVEGRGKGGKGSEVSMRLSVEQEEEFLRAGPKPLCAEGVQAARSIYL